ncbi:reverse transcriptase domain-containing protein [Tanacetum coccineum]|uniref:Reverse transcriptase domain-containing protein n=1 Tax=Tanacetum coccineum TaxID=301880 RepID=A0ABQ4XJF0_9ASTR
MAHDSMNQVVREEATVGKNVSNKRKLGSDHGMDSNQQQSKRIEVVRAHATGACNKKAYAGNLLYCNKCKWHHIGSCTVKCGNCKRVRHTTKNCRTSAPATIMRASVANQKPAVTYFGCGAKRHFKSKCPRWKNQMYDNQKKKEEKSTRTLSALTWWNSHKRTIRTDAAYAWTWKELMKLMTEVYYPRNEIQKIEIELWNLAVRGYAARDAENKRRLANNPRDNRVQQPPLKRQNVEKAYTVGNHKNKAYAGILPLCDKCKLHHHGPCPFRCGNCKKVGHQARDRWASTTMTCYGCGGKGHTKRYCLELGNQNGDGEAGQNLDIVMGTDISNIARKPSKMGKHGHENGRACKSRKPKSKSQPWSNLNQQKSKTKGQNL